MKRSRRTFVTMLAVAVATPLRLHAQSPIKRVAVVMPFAETDQEAQARAKAFRQRIQELGWTEGRNIRIDYRWAAGNAQQAQDHAAAVVTLAPDVIVAGGTPAVAAALKATRTIPIVFVTVVDPVGAGFVESLARPGGNVTGFSTFDAAMAGKWLEVLREVRPAIKRVAVLSDPVFKGFNSLTRTIDELASRAAIAVTQITFNKDSDQLEAALGAFAHAADGAMIVIPTAHNNFQRRRIIAAAAKHRLPAIYPFRNYVVDGGLMCYGFDSTDGYRQSAGYVDRILRGAKPGDLPVQAPTKYELVLNMKTAKALGITIPESVRLQAHEIIA